MDDAQLVLAVARAAARLAFFSEESIRTTLLVVVATLEDDVCDLRVPAAGARADQGPMRAALLQRQARDLAERRQADPLIDRAEHGDAGRAPRRQAACTGLISPDT